MAESRKRPYSEEHDNVAVKKRALSSTMDSPVQMNGSPDDHLGGGDEPQNEDEVERFRKVAIYRRMKQYARRHEHSQRRVRELEMKSLVHESERIAVEACWSQLLDTVSSFVARSDLRHGVKEEEEEEGEPDGVDTTTSSSSASVLAESLRKRMAITQKFISAFVQMAGNAKHLSTDELYSKFQDSRKQCTILQSELELAKSRVDDLEKQCEKYYDDWLVAENKVQRLEGPTKRELSRSASAVVPNGVREEVVKGEKVASPIIPIAVEVPPVVQQDMGVPKELLELRDNKITELERENALLRDQANMYKIELVQMSEETVSRNPFYKVLMDHASRQQHLVTELGDELGRARQEIVTLNSTHSSWRESVTTAATKEIDDLKALLKKRDDENSRLRAQRDQQSAELNERKAKSTSKQSLVDEFKLLAESRSERIAILQSEVKRLRCRLAASHGEEDLLKFLSNSEDESLAYTQHLKTRVQEAEAKCQKLEATLARTERPSESALREQLAQAHQRVQKYESVFGSNPSSQQLSKQLEERVAELRAMQVKEKQHEQSEAALFTELDKLSAAWEELDRTLKAKVYDLQGLEERASKHGIEKAKAENKYYSAMRDKEASENERKNIARNLEKQTKVIDNLSKSEQTLHNTVATLEKESSTYKRILQSYQSDLDALKKECADWKARHEAEVKRQSETRQQAQVEKNKVVKEKEGEIARLGEELGKVGRELEGLKTRVKEGGSNANAANALPVGNSGSGAGMEETKQELDKCMRLLKCSICQGAFRTHIITKCMHSFCKGCVDARISHRHRKCPACNIAFSTSEVQQFYLQ